MREPISASGNGPNSAQFRCNLTPLDATLVSSLLCIANKGLTQYLTPLDATLTRNTGGGRRLHSFLLLHRHVTKNSSPQLLSNQHFQTVTPVSPLECAFTKTAGCHPLFLPLCTLFTRNVSQLFSFQRDPHSFHKPPAVWGSIPSP